MELVEAALPRGLRDLLPGEMIARQRMIATIQRVYELYGFVPIASPAIEHLRVLAGSGGAEASASIFRVQGPEDDPLGLRFDLTVPLARFMAQYPEIPRPFRRYQVGSVFRADKPGPGRFREFTQFDLDSVGTPSEIADTEIIAGMCDTLSALEVGPFRVRFSSRRVLNLLMPLAGIDQGLAADVFRVLDKLDKIGIEKVRRELTTGYKDESGDTITGVGLQMEQVSRIEKFLAIKGESRDEVLVGVRDVFSGVEGAAEAIDPLEKISRHLKALDYHEDRAVIDLSIARGLAYYTGPVFEAVLLDAPEFGSVFGGGRYDDLVMRFLGERVPATGASIGVDRLLAALIKLGRTGTRKATAQILVTTIDPSLMDDYLAITYELRRAGVPTELYLGPESGLGKQIKYADRAGIPLVLILGSDEKTKGIVTLKDLEAGAKGAAQLSQNRDQWRQLRPGQFEVARTDLVKAAKDFSR
ncbi:MAG: histidine--tRNA ligase [Vicinamibacteria bacterium]